MTEEHPAADVPRSEQTERMVGRLWAAYHMTDLSLRTESELRGLCWEAARYLKIIAEESTSWRERCERQMELKSQAQITALKAEERLATALQQCANGAALVRAVDHYTDCLAEFGDQVIDDKCLCSACTEHLQAVTDALAALATDAPASPRGSVLRTDLMVTDPNLPPGAVRVRTGGKGARLGVEQRRSCYCGTPSATHDVACPMATPERGTGGDTEPREPGCKCHWEAGDSPCPVHGEDEERGACPGCGGSGVLRRSWQDYRCADCNGTGKLLDNATNEATK